jgi:8-oxo-dGTP pyrophosphatase MutT (NUDIX family)
VIEEIRRRLAAYSPHELANEGRARAAVLVPIYDLHGELHIIFTKRTDTVHSHKGEVSFPGGAMEATDPDLRYTALRESMEEIGLQPSHVTVTGKLDDIVTISDFHVTPYVGEVDPALAPYAWNPHEVEVAEILEVPLSHLLDAANYVEVPRQREGELVMQPGVKFGEHIIWGATWRMLRNFLDVALVGDGQVVERPVVG